MNVWDILILMAVAVSAVFAVRHIKNGGGKCGGSCSSCGYADGCGKKKQI